MAKLSSTEKARILREKRDAKIVKMYRTGKYSTRTLAPKVGLSKTRVAEIVAR